MSDNAIPPQNGQPPGPEYQSTNGIVPPQNPLTANTECLERFTRNFETSARRWELIVYPALFAFIVLAAYGFFLVYSLTRDISHMSNNVTQMTMSVDTMSNSLTAVSSRMQSVSLNMDDIAHKMDNLSPMRVSMESMDRSTQYMALTTEQMRRNMTGMNATMANMNNSIRPLRKIGGFMPW